MKGGESVGMWSGGGRTRVVLGDGGGLNGEFGGRGFRRIDGFEGNLCGTSSGALDCQMEDEWG